ncbi:hypothetical protein L1987_15237 [Smallanthus sonchifolius]|uniref:Uncharacterized protein n=1 Tax=Smallanthus sonchifolius TaxID=185202 RepID=A0ACB9J792_9ASTR|nr:hypothetical protein L1987_15237 [Smallanthus sonchifolius]
MDASDSDSDLSFLSSPTVRLNTEQESKRREEEKVKEGWKEVTGLEWEEDEESFLPLSIPQNTNEAEAEIPTASLTSAVEVNEAEVEASNKDKGKGLMTKEDEERIREEWIEALISQGEDVDYLEKLSTKEIYRAFMGQQGLLANKKRAKEEEKAKQKSRRPLPSTKEPMKKERS